MDRKNSSTLKGQFLETFDEVKKGGEYIVEDDGSELTVQSGQTSIYITYTKNNKKDVKYKIGGFLLCQTH